MEIKIEVNHYFHGNTAIENKIDQILSRLDDTEKIITSLGKVREISDKLGSAMEENSGNVP